MSCCLECHFRFEEEHALRYLPQSLADWVLQEHRRLEEAGFPREEVLAHAREEMRFFSQHVPPAVVARIDEDHREYSAQVGDGAEFIRL